VQPYYYPNYETVTSPTVLITPPTVTAPVTQTGTTAVFAVPAEVPPAPAAPSDPSLPQTGDGTTVDSSTPAPSVAS
jgi:hypothetical protein